MVNQPRRAWHIIRIAKREVILFFTALMFFTRLPVPKRLPFSQAYLNHAARYFPLVGVLVGGIGAVTVWLAGLIFPPPVAILLSMVATVLATGAFHEDGFADSCDGFGGGYTKARVLEIMKDSRLGTFGALGLVLMLALKFTALMQLDTAQLPWALVAGHALSRFASVTLIVGLKYVRDDLTGKAKPLAVKLSGGAFLVAALFGFAPVIWLATDFAWAQGVFLLWTLVPVAAMTALAAAYFVRRIGGYTGDCLGAVQQATEVTFYLAIVAFNSVFGLG